MSFASRRLASIAKARIAAGTWGRANAGRRVYLPGFALGPKVLNYVPGALLRLARLELEAIPGRMRARSRRRAAPLPSADTPVSALGSQRTK